MTEQAAPAPVKVSESSAPEAQPIEVKSGEYHFGYVEPKNAYKVRLALPNPSDKPLLIRSARSECKCMTASAPDKTVLPGQPLVVQVVLQAPEKPIPYNQRLLFQTDNPKCPNITLRIKADVGLPLAAEPSRPGSKDDAFRRTIRGPRDRLQPRQGSHPPCLQHFR